MKYILLLLVMTLSGCSESTPIIPEQWRLAEKLCEQNAGIKYVYPADFTWVSTKVTLTTVCMNGARFVQDHSVLKEK